jgi:hypothetical protein
VDLWWSVGCWADEINYDWIKIDYLLKFRYLMGHLGWKKNICLIPVLFQVGYRWYTRIKNISRTYPRRVGYPIPIPNRHP